ncbi:hypothetical protein HPB47_028006 [Ixodes persulcatus]|uniref:Uncharacterized protein n=1 Tax=Ixodes persulcatus TaxID=34615 RepID=A0AC60PUH3_IXOPE|nr:hypothetical protein HPB47_028006 [Ixodes persulcatus]
MSLRARRQVADDKLDQATVQQVQVSESGEITASDILQQAFQEASGEFEQVAVTYATVEDGVAVLHGSLPDGILQQQVNEDGQIVQPVTLADVVSDTGAEAAEPTAEAAETEEPANIAEDDAATGEAAADFVDESGAEQAVLVQDDAVEEGGNEDAAMQEDEEPAVASPESEEATASSPSVPVRIQPASSSSGTLQQIGLPQKQSSAPLGSSENPIQIIQQGNTYHSTQVLSPEQLQQIAHVLQQQQVNRAIQNGGSAVVFNPQTNTRIIYRVIYPSELGSKSSSSSTTTRASSGRGRGTYSTRGRGRPRGRGFARRVVEEDDPRSDGPELSREEKEEKKKHRPRTRSGRISKPPSYMVKDYKRIHHLDFDDEPYDDSDGGYSDYQVSDDEERSGRRSFTGLGGRPRNYKCPTCSKSYIGRGGLCRHLRLYPDHGNPSDVEELSVHDETSNTPPPSSAMDRQPGEGRSSDAGDRNPAMMAAPQRSRYADLASIRRKSRLREAARACRDEEVMEVVLPRVTEMVSLWEFLLSKCEKGDPPQLQVPDMLIQMEELLREMRALGQESLKAVESSDVGGTLVKIEDEAVAQALGLPTGLYAVLEEEPAKPIPVTRKRPRQEGQASQQGSQQGGAGTVEFVTPEEMVAALHGEPLPPNKRMRLDDEDSFVVLPPDSEGAKTDKETAAIIEATLNSDSLSENMLENLEFAGLPVADENAVTNGGEEQEAAPVATTIARQTKPAAVKQTTAVTTQQTTRPSPSSFQFVQQAGTQKIQILPGQSLLSRNFVRVVTSSEGTPVANDAAAAATAVTVVAQESASPPEAEAAEPAVQPDEQPEAADQAAAGEEEEEKQTETLVQVVESHGNEDSQHEVTQVVCAEEEGESQNGGESQPVIRQYMLPDGQIVSAYEDAEGSLVQLATPEEETTTALGNVVIVHNPDGTTTLQVPNDGSIPIETVQALLAMDQSAMVVQTQEEATAETA